jgi:hypothetical protein
MEGIQRDNEIKEGEMASPPVRPDNDSLLVGEETKQSHRRCTHLCKRFKGKRTTDIGEVNKY